MENPIATPDAAEFLTTLGQLLSTASLYPSGHPARSATLEAAWEDLQRLLEHGEPVFSFLDDTVLYGRLELRDLRSWDLGTRLHHAGIQRVEFRWGVTREELDELADHVRDRLGGIGATAESEARLPHIRIGAVTVRVEACEPAERDGADAAPIHLDEELAAVGWVYREAAGDQVAVHEVKLAVESLSIALEGLLRSGSHLIAIKSSDQYTAIHCMNVAILSMTLAERIGYGAQAIREIGEAAMLHDIGKTKTPPEILNKPGLLSSEERRLIENHTVEGCRLLLASDFQGRLAATVAYEHHMWGGGRGYPAPLDGRSPHRISRLVQVCDVYDALRTRRPFRPAREAEESLRFLEERAGPLFDLELVEAFTRMVREMELREPRARPVTEQERRAAAGHTAEDQSSDRLETRLEAIAESLLAPEPAATVDWLEILEAR